MEQITTQTTPETPGNSAQTKPQEPVNQQKEADGREKIKRLQKIPPHIW